MSARWPPLPNRDNMRTFIIEPPLSDAPAHHLLIADDHPLFRGALREAVHGLLAGAEVAEAGSFEEVSDFLEHGGG